MTTDKVKKTRAPKKMPVETLTTHAKNLSLEEKVALRNNLNMFIDQEKTKIQKQLELITA